MRMCRDMLCCAFAWNWPSRAPGHVYRPCGTCTDAQPRACVPHALRPQRLYAEGRHAELLLLPPTFSAVLKQYLQQHPQLLWLHLLRCNEFGEAAATLAQVGAPCAGRHGRGHPDICTVAATPIHGSAKCTHDMPRACTRLTR